MIRLKFVFTLFIFIVLLGCAATPEQIKEMYERQSRLEAKMEQLSQDIKTLKANRDEQITQLESRVESIEQAYLKQKKRLDELEKNEKNELEKKEAFSDFPSAKSPDAQYRIAESYYREGKFKDAVLEFQRFIDTYPQDRRVPISYLKQGLSLINIGRKEEAKPFLRALIDKFPKSEEAKIAKEKLKEIAGKN